MRSLAEYIMRGRKQAVIAAFIFAWIPLFSWIADVITCFVTLRKGPKEGLYVLPWALLANIVYASLGNHDWYMVALLYNVLGTSIASYLLAILLRETNSWSIILQVAMFVGVLAVIVVHIVDPNITLHWTNDLQSYLQQAGDGQLSSADLQDNISFYASIFLGLQISFMLIGDLFNLIMARYLQSILYNPGAIREELCNIRVGITSVVFLILLGLASIGKIAVAIDCLPVVLVTFVIAGTSLVHYFLVKANANMLWFVVFYGLLLFIMPLLIVLAIVDCWRNFRQRFKFV